MHKAVIGSGTVAGGSEIGYGGKASNNQTSGVTNTITAADLGSISNGDLLIYVVADDSDAVCTDPAGFIEIDNTSNGTSRITVGYKVASAESGDYAFTVAGVASVVVMLRLTKTGGTWRVVDNSEGTGTADITTTSVTATDGSVLVVLCGYDDAQTLTAVPTDMTQVEFESDSTPTVVGAMFYQLSMVAGGVTKDVNVDAATGEVSCQAVIFDLNG